jgi:hypothetical protein
MKKRTLLLLFAIFAFQFISGQSATETWYRNRIGMYGGGGMGFNKVAIGTLTDGSVASITFGGGGTVRIEYSHYFSHHFNVTFNIGGMFSNLDKEVTNGEMSFTRNNISIAPYYIVPIGGTGKAQLGFGAGLDIFYIAKLTFDLSKISGGSKDEWTYNPAVGGHVAMNFEAALSKRFTLNGGMKLHFSKFSFEKGSNSVPTTDDLKNPNGSGLDLVLGICYRFNWKKQA